ncbi:hypothetical protein JTB14_013307 [Gonioctena quinquepunctata]|nr:hypothetical protein JTB14_013307 [Gonioctena quinquepunctata]
MNIGIQTAKLKRWNFRKANWRLFQYEVEKNIQETNVGMEHYKQFVNILHEETKKSIPRGFQIRRNYEATGDHQLPYQIMSSLDSARLQRWRETTHSSRKGWNLLRRLGSAVPPPDKKLSINPNDIADRLQNISKISTPDKAFAREINKAVSANLRSLPQQSQWSTPFSMNELNIALARMKLRKAPGPDQVFPKFLKNLGNSNGY